MSGGTVVTIGALRGSSDSLSRSARKEGRVTTGNGGHVRPLLSDPLIRGTSSLMANTLLASPLAVAFWIGVAFGLTGVGVAWLAANSLVASWSFPA